MIVYGKCFGVVKITGVIETQYLSFLARESKCMPQGGMEGLCRVGIGCAQPDVWKTTSADTNVDRSLGRGGSFWSGVDHLH